MLCLIVVYTMLWSPWRKSLERLRVEVPEARAQLAWMREALPRLKTLRAEQETRAMERMTIGAGTPLTAVERWRTVWHQHNQPLRIEPLGDHAVRVVFDKIVFDELVAGLTDLERHTGLVLQTIEIARTSAPGRVDVRLVLRRP